MAKRSTSEKVPQEIQAKFDEITGLIDTFCADYLNDEYAGLCRQAAATLARKRPSPLTSGKANIWACGIVHAIGMVNFVTDPSQNPHVKSSDIWDAFGVGQSTCHAKSKQIRDLLKMHRMDVKWSLQSLIKRNPLVWMVSVNGLIVDVRYMPREVQEEALRKGIIPYLPD